jgi:hypothetical protein
LRYLSNQDQTFEQLNMSFGPIVANSEVSFSMIPVGDAGPKNGLFLREQRPADGDPKQGGIESVMNPLVRDIRFEFFDGTNWQTAWDTTGTQKGSLPNAVRVTYLLNGEKQPRSFLVQLALTGAGSAATAAGTGASSGGNG